jgi:L-asparaginase II
VATQEAMRLRGEKPGPNRHNCSGKHNGFLAYALLRGLPIEDYINPQHPIQQTIIEVFREMCGVDAKTVQIGVDGCSAPVFGLPLYNAALGYARLSDPQSLSKERAKACKAITTAMSGFPNMIGGPGEFDTDLMLAAAGKLVTKAGAEGYQSVGILPDAIKPGSPGIGISIKISDGDTLYRARPVVTLEVLRQLGFVFDPAKQSSLAGYGIHPVYNWRKIEVGMIQPCFKLEFA